MAMPADNYTAFSAGQFSGRNDRRYHPYLFSLKVKLIHLKNKLGKFKNLFNSNHRHDEPHERAIDARRKEISDSHRYGSFAPVTQGNEVKWYVDGRDYFWAVSVAFENASECIYIEDWWLSPELFLRRPPAESEEWRLDQVLKRKAEQGVKIYIIVYKEVCMFQFFCVMYDDLGADSGM
jgi:phospholipase D1/2